MRHNEIVKTSVWLIETIRRFGPLTLEELSGIWEKSSLSYGKSLSRTSFNRYRDEIDDVFGIKIICDRSAGFVYSIENSEDLNTRSAQDWMATTLSLNNLMAENREVRDRIILEPIPSEGANLSSLIEAMKGERKVKISYRRYTSEDAKSYIVIPYCVKLYHRRWYAIVRVDGHKNLIALSLDRIEAVEITGKKFKTDTDFDAETYFRDSFGIVRDDDVEIADVRIRTYGTERFYMRDLPLHHSQKMIEEGKDYIDYEVSLRPTEDFLGQILSRGPWVKIISPRELADKLVEMLIKTQGNYSD